MLGCIAILQRQILQASFLKRAGMCPYSLGSFFPNMAEIMGFLGTGGVSCCVAVLLLLARGAEAQTTCGAQNTGDGVFICYPNPFQNKADSTVPETFHLSAQGNAPEGHVAVAYRILIDNRLVYVKKLLTPTQKLSIETNVKSPFDSGSHKLQLVVLGAGSAEVKELRFYSSKNGSFCDPFSRADPRICSPSPTRPPLEWSLKETTPKGSSDDAFDGYSAYLKLYGQNLKSIEADASDAMTVDAQGNLYVASHALADVDLRKYSPNGSLIYASLIRSCGDGFLSVAGLAIDNAARVWIAGNTNACLRTTPNAIHSQGSKTGRATGFIMLVDTKKPGATAQLYVSYLSPVENRISAIRADSEGNVYITGTVTAREFPHDSLLSVTKGSAGALGAPLGFVAAVDRLGSGFQWSTLLENAQLNDLALDRTGGVYVTGRVMCRAPRQAGVACEDVFAARLSDRGHRFSYLARFGGAAEDEGRAIGATDSGAWIFVTSATAVVALQSCKTGILYARSMREDNDNAQVEIALAPAMEAFTAALSGTLQAGELGTASKRLRASVQIAPECASAPQ